MKKRLISFVLCVVLLMAVPLSVLAAQEARIIQNVWIQDTDMTIVCADPEAEDGVYQVMVDGSSVPVDISDLQTEQIPVTVFCLVDTSGSISQFKLELIQETLLELSNSMGEQDNMVIATLGNDLEVGPVLWTKAEREAAIAQISASHEDTNLFAGIVQSLNRLTSDTSYNSYGCLVVLSDGMDKQDNGMTEQEVMNAIAAARCPVFTVALVEDYTEREAGKVLGSFARSSYGGIHQTTANEGGDKHIRWDVEGSEFGACIWSAVQNMSVLHVDLSGIAVDDRKTEVRLDITFECGSNSYSDSRNLNVNDLPAPPQETEPPASTPEDQSVVPGSTDAADPTETTVTEQKTFLEKNWIWIVVAVILIILAVILVVVKKSRDSKKQNNTTFMDQESSTTPGTMGFEPFNPFGQDNLGSTVMEGETQGETIGATVDGTAGGTVSGTVGGEIEQVLNQMFLVSLTDIPYGHIQLSFKVKAVEQVIFGRGGKETNFVINQTDKQLSGKHFAMTLQKDYFCIQDMKSTNGTWVNGIPIADRGWIKIESGDKIRAGGFEYRVTIEEA